MFIEFPYIEGGLLLLITQASAPLAASKNGNSFCNLLQSGVLSNKVRIAPQIGWKVCRMRGGSPLRPNFSRGCISVTKQKFYGFLLFFTKILRHPAAEI